VNNTEAKKIVEALLFASPEPLTQKKINTIFHSVNPDLKKIAHELNDKYAIGDHSFEIKSVAGGYQLVSKAEYKVYISRMLNRSGKITLSKASLDSLAIIAYKQPLGRHDIDAIRGVDSSGVLKNLLNKNLIKIKGRGSGPGRPLLYKTTEKFLEYFGINRISDLPKLKEISELVESDAGLGRQIAVFNEKNEDTEISKDSILK
tara:strand:+ start:2096 stop:2707 length:612 start_codon:yes stop_codon:yes gene_type:complete